MGDNATIQRIKNVSQFFKIIFQVLMICYPLLLVYAWMHTPNQVVLIKGALNMSFVPSAYSQNILHSLTFSERLFGFLVSTTFWLIDAYILYTLIQLFKLYEKNIIFTLKNVRYIRNIGVALFLAQLLNPMYEILMGLILTIHNPPGHRFTSVSFDQSNIAILFLALMLMLISWIMIEGCKMRDEQLLTI